jgi:hypothetical protein
MMVPLSALKVAPDAFISQRKVQRFKEEYFDHKVGQLESPADRAASIMLLADLLINVTTVARMQKATSPGVVDLCHYIAENLRYRIASSKPNVWSLDDCLADYAEVAEHFGITKLYDYALGMVEAETVDLTVEK